MLKQWTGTSKDWLDCQPRDTQLLFFGIADPILYLDTLALWRLILGLSASKSILASKNPRTKWPKVDTFLFCFLGSTDKKVFDASYDSVAFVIVQEGFWLFLPLWLWLGRNTQRGVSDAIKVLEKPKSSLVAYGVWLQYPVDNVLPSNTIFSRWGFRNIVSEFSPVFG